MIKKVILFSIFGILLLFLIGLLVSDKSFSIHLAESHIKDGEWNKGIEILTSVSPENEHYDEAKSKLARLQKGYKIFNKASGDWRYKASDGNVYKVLLSNKNSRTFLYKKDRNTILNVAKKLYNSGQANWRPHIRYIDYIDGKLKIIRYLVGDRTEEFLIFK